MKKQIIKIDNIVGNKGGANYIYMKLLRMKEILSIGVDLEKGAIEVYHVYDFEREDIIRILSRSGFPEAGTSTISQKCLALVNSFIGVIS